MGKIRPTAAWGHFKEYLDLLLREIHIKYCALSDVRVCNSIKYWRARIHSETQEHCKRKTDDCKPYCEKYCDHFVRTILRCPPMCFDPMTHKCNCDGGDGNDEYLEYMTRCPQDNSQSNQTDVLLPADKHVVAYLHKFMVKEDCRK